jgi:hypothetical protein
VDTAVKPFCNERSALAPASRSPMWTDGEKRHAELKNAPSWAIHRNLRSRFLPSRQDAHPPVPRRHTVGGADMI